MAKTDIESAFRIISVHPEDYERLGFKWENQYFYDKCLPMGCSSSCKIFETFSTAVEWIANIKAGCTHVVHILDEFLLIEKSEQLAQRSLDRFLNTCARIGIPMSDEKTYLPTQVIELLGIEVDSVRSEARTATR